jgi:two-component system NtrC family sensor kinase
MAAQYGTRSVMGAPLILFGEVIGAIVFTHDVDPEFFNDDLATKATILAGQIGSLLEAKRLNQASQQEHRRAEVLVEAAQAMPAGLDAATAVGALADRVRSVLHARLVCVLLRRGEGFEIGAVSADTPSHQDSARQMLAGPALAWVAKVADQALLAAEPATVTCDGEAPAILGEAGSKTLLAAPFRTSCAQGAILVYPGHGAFTAEDRSLLSALAGFGGVAIANAELYATAAEHAQELHQLLEIASELTSVGNFDGFMQRFVERAVGFLGFRRCFLALLENEVFQVRWGALEGKAHPIDAPFPSGVASQALLRKEPFWTDDASQVAGGNLEGITKWAIRQLLAVPLLGSDGQVLGMFGVLDQREGTPISAENVRRAKTLAAEVSVALEMTRNLHLSEQHRRRAEALMSLALETSSLWGAGEFARRFVSRAASLMGARIAALLLKQEAGLESVALQGMSGEASQWRKLKAAVNELLAHCSLPIIAGPAADLLGPSVASVLGLKELLVAVLRGSGDEVVGVLLLANREGPLTDPDKQLLQVIAGQASVSLEKARLFARMDQANRHWVEIFDAITDFIVVHDESHHVLRVNRSLADFIGVRPNELIGISMSALLAMATETSPRACPFCRSGIEGTDEFVQPVLERTYLVSTSRIHARESEGWQTIHVLKDITDRREAERRYRELFDNIQEGLFFTTPEGRFVEVNDALVRMLGYDRREELLQPEAPTQIYFTEDRRREFVRLMEEKGSLRNYHATLRRRDGSPIHVLMNAFAARDAEGAVVQFRGLMLDITELKNFQAELQRERDFSSKILNNTQSLILVADTAGLITYANRRWQEAGGYEHPHLVGRPLTGLIPPGRQQALNDALQATLAGQQVDNLELPVLRTDGRAGQFSVNLSPMRDEQGHVSSIVVVMTDITDAAMLQAKLMHTEKMAAVGQLVSGVAHEVNNPLTAILGFADLLMENPAIPDSAKKDLRVILQEAQRTKQIVQNLLSFARQMPPQRRPVQVNGILTRTIQLRAYDFSSHGVEVIEHFHGNMPEVVGDPHQLQQVFLNILNNAYDAVHETNRPPRIEIMTSAAGGYAEVSFRDNGPGIVQTERIFDPFFTTKEVGKGTGLGLSICYGIVREHGGEISCHNNEDGPGATFVVRLPAVSEVGRMSASAGTVQQ